MSDLKLMQPSFTSGEISPALYARVDLAKYRAALKSALNVFVHPHGGVSNRAGLEFCEEVKISANPTRLLPFQFGLDQSYGVEIGNIYFRVLKDGSYILNATTVAITSVTNANPGVFTAAAHGFLAGQDIYVSGFSRADLAGRRLYVFSPTTNTFQLKDAFGNLIDTTTWGALGAGSANAFIETATPYSSADLFDICATQEADVQYWTHTLYPIEKLSRLSETSWTLATPTLAPSISAPGAAPTVVASPSSGSVTPYNYKYSAISATTGEESLPSAASANQTNDLTVAGNKNTLTLTAVTGASRYVIYKLDNGVYGYIGGTTGLSFVDQNITADVSDGPQTGNNPFVGAGNYPRCSTFYEQRLVFAAPLNNPQAVFMSQSTSYENFGFSTPAKASDSLSFRIRARQVNVIRAMLPTRGLMLLSSGAEWTVSGGSQDFISPSQIVIKNEGYRGAASVQPLVVGNVILFAQRSGGVIRDFSYDFTNDSFTGTDLTILARHLFEGRQIKSWAYAQALYSIVWVILDNGTCVSLTYLKEHQVWAWTRHQTDGVFEDVMVLQTATEDVPYFIIRRTINGQSKRYIERLRSRLITDVVDGFFVDCGLTYNGAPATVIAGFWHLEGKTVNALADGNVVRNLVVTNGRITLPRAASKVHAGLPYTAEIRTLEADMGMLQTMGTVQGRMKSVSEVTIRVEKSRGMFIGSERERMTEWKQRAGEDWNEAISLYTGDVFHTIDADWSTVASIVIRQTDPLPMTILALMPETEVGG